MIALHLHPSVCCFRLFVQPLFWTSIARVSLGLCVCVTAEALCCHFDGRLLILEPERYHGNPGGLSGQDLWSNSGVNGSDDDGDDRKAPKNFICLILSGRLSMSLFHMVTKYVLVLDNCNASLVQVTTRYCNHLRRALAFFHSRLTPWNRSVQVNLPAKPL